MSEFVQFDRYGMPQVFILDENGEELEKMQFPMRCTKCGLVHDTAKVTVTGRYADCTMWKCPGCGRTIDDRPIGWGGSAEPLDAGR